MSKLPIGSRHSLQYRGGSDTLTELGRKLVEGSLTDDALLRETGTGPTSRILPHANVIKIGGQSMIDRGRSAVFPILDELVEDLGRHKMIIGTGAGTRARHAYSVGVDLSLPTGVLGVLATFVSMQNVRMIHYLLAKHLAGRCRYIGLDRSREMLLQFRARSPHALLLLSDAAQPWPLASRSVRAVFLSRVAHLLARENLLAQLVRVAHPEGCYVLFGPRARDPESEPRTLQRELHARLRAHGFQPRQGEGDTRGHLEALIEHGAQPLPEQIAAEWRVER